MSNPDNLGFQASSPDGRERYVLLCFRPDAEGRVAVREWSGADHGGRESNVPVDEVMARVETWRSAGWSFTESPERIAGWLRDGR